MNAATARPGRASECLVTGRLVLAPNQHAALDETFRVFADACNWAVATGLRAGTRGTVRLHHLCYHELRARFGLHANLAVRSVACAARLLKEEGGPCRHPPTCIEYDRRIFSVCARGQSVSLATVAGRLKGVRAVFDGPVAGYVFHRATLHKHDQQYVLRLYGSPDGVKPDPSV